MIAFSIGSTCYPCRSVSFRYNKATQQWELSTSSAEACGEGSMMLQRLAWCEMVLFGISVEGYISHTTIGYYRLSIYNIYIDIIYIVESHDFVHRKGPCLLVMAKAQHRCISKVRGPTSYLTKCFISSRKAS